MEIKLAGWNPFKRKNAAKPARGEALQTAVVKPLIREAHRRGPEAAGLPRFNTTASDQMSELARPFLEQVDALEELHAIWSDAAGTEGSPTAEP